MTTSSTPVTLISPRCRGSLDDDWLPVMHSRGLVVITRAQRIRYRPVEKQLWISRKVRGFILTGRKSQSTLDSLLVVERHWSQIEAVVDTRPDGPWMYAVTEERLREIALS